MQSESLTLVIQNKIELISKNKGLVLFIFSVVALLIYGHTLGFGYTFLDDFELIHDRRELFSDIGNFQKLFQMPIFSDPKTEFYRPFLALSFMFDYQWSELFFGTLDSTLPFRVTNLLLHVLASWSLFRILIALRYNEVLALFVGFFLLIHPLFVGAVAWIPGRNDSILALLVYGQINLYLKYLSNVDNSREEFFPPLRYFGPIFVLFFLSLLTKENAVVVPFLGFLWLKSEKLKMPRKHVLLAISGLGICLICVSILRSHGLSFTKSTFYFGSLTTLFSGLPSLILYFSKSLLPLHVEIVPALKMGTLLLSGIICSAFGYVVYSFRASLNWRRVLFGFAWILAFLLPTFLLPPKSNGSYYLEHRFYLPAFGVAIILCEILIVAKLKGYLAKTGIYIASAVLILCVVQDLLKSRFYSDRITFWQEVVSENPNLSFALRNYGAMLVADRRFVEAEQVLTRAIANDPKDTLSRMNIGIMKFSEKKFDEAEQWLTEEIKHNPDSALGWYNLGILYLVTKRYESANDALEKSLKENPEYLPAKKAKEDVMRRLREK